MFQYVTLKKSQDDVEKTLFREEVNGDPSESVAHERHGKKCLLSQVLSTRSANIHLDVNDLAMGISLGKH